MILGYENSKILQLASDYQSEITDGVVQYDYEDGKLFGAGFTTGTLENPANPFIEVYRLPQGERGEIDCKCMECPYEDEDFAHLIEEEPDIYFDSKEKCCLEAYTYDGFSEDWENNFKESVEEQIRDVLSEHLDDTISKLNEIRIALSDRFEPHNYFNVRNDDWEMRVLDSYVDSALENGFRTSVSPIDYLNGDIENICLSIEEEYVEVAYLLREGDLNGALELLQ